MNLEKFSVRFEYMIKSLGYKGATAFAKELGYSSPEKISRIIREEGNMPSAEMLSDIAKRFDEINLTWLLTGRGEMLVRDAKAENQNVINDPVAGVDLHKIEAKIEYLMKQMQDTTIQVIEYSKAVERHEEQLKRLTGK